MKKMIITGMSAMVLMTLMASGAQAATEVPSSSTTKTEVTTGSSQTKKTNNHSNDKTDHSSDKNDHSKDNKNHSGDKGNHKGGKHETNGKKVALKDSKIVTVDEAVAVYTKAHPKSDVVSVDLENKHNSFVYKIKGKDAKNKFKVSIDAESKKVLKDKTKTLESDDKNLAKIETKGTITPQKAAEIAEKAAGKGTAQDFELKNKSNTFYWSVEVKDGHNDTDVKIDAKTGKVLETQKDD